MIQRLQYCPVHFRNNELNQQPKAEETSVNKDITQAETTDEMEPKASFMETFQKAKKAGVDILKDINIFTNTSGGVLRGLSDGAIVTVGVASIGKSLMSSKDEKGLKVLGKIGSSVLSDITSAIKGIGSYAKRVFTEDKAMYKHLGELASLPGKFYSTYMKNNKALAAGATMAGLAVLTLRTLQGKMYANEKNASLDHKTNQGHV